MVACGRSNVSTSTFNGSEALDRVILKPGSNPPALSCQPPPVVNICSTINTAWISESMLTVRPVARKRAARITPAKILLVPRPLPWGAVDQVWSSKPAWYFLLSCSDNVSLEGRVTMSRKQKQALRRAPNGVNYKTFRGRLQLKIWEILFKVYREFKSVWGPTGSHGHSLSRFP